MKSFLNNCRRIYFKRIGHWKRIVSLLLIAATALVLPACGEGQRPFDQEENKNILIYAALNPISKEVKTSLQKFNKGHTDIQIEVHDYSDEGGLERLRTELVLGKVPDIMEMHYFGKNGARVGAKANYYVLPGSYANQEDEYWMPYKQMAQKGYLEDLWPYIENDPKLGRDGVQQAVLEAAESNNGLYILFDRFVIFTLCGRESVVGDRYSWTMEELMDALDDMPEWSSILRYNMTRWEIYNNLLRFSLEQYVDRETGETFFGGQGFRNLVDFLMTFPDEADYEDPVAAEEEVIDCIRHGEQMLEGKMVDWPQDIVHADSIWGERAAFPGYPTADGSSGSFFYPTGTILAMSSTCRNKEAAWEYLREPILSHRSRSSGLKTLGNIPVNQHDYEMLLLAEVDQVKKLLVNFSEKEVQSLFWVEHFSVGGHIPMLHILTEEDTERHRELVNHTTRLYWPDDGLASIVWESLGPYFAGDRDWDATLRLLENRTELYLKEQM